MKWRKRVLKDYLLYVVVDKKSCGNRDLATITRKAIAGGADVIQLRDKISKREIVLAEARALRDLTRRHGVTFIINDDPAIARASDADGVHIGQGDVSPSEARAIIGDDKMVGVSSHSLGQALKGERDGATYISVGPVFPTTTKPRLRAVGLDLIRHVKSSVKIPFVAIGGINHNNMRDVLEAGAGRIAVVSAAMLKDDVEEATRELKKALVSAKPPLRKKAKVSGQRKKKSNDAVGARKKR